MYIESTYFESVKVILSIRILDIYISSVYFSITVK